MEQYVWHSMHYDPKETMETLYDTYVDSIFRFLYNRLGNKEKAIDITQEVFLKVWQSYLSKGHTPEYPKALLFTIARNMIINSYARDARTVSLETLMEDGFDVADGLDTATQARATELYAMLDRLSTDDATLLTYRYLEELSIPEIAQIYSISENACSVRIHRALARLASLYNKQAHE